MARGRTAIRSSMPSKAGWRWQKSPSWVVSTVTRERAKAFSRESFTALPKSKRRPTPQTKKGPSGSLSASFRISVGGTLSGMHSGPTNKTRVAFETRRVFSRRVPAEVESLREAVLSSCQRHSIIHHLSFIISFGLWVPVLYFIVAPHQLRFGVASAPSW